MSLSKTLTFVLLYLFITPYAYSTTLIPNDKCALVIASRETKSEVKTYIQEEVRDKRFLTVYKSKNGWYAITTGFLTLDEQRAVIERWRAENKIPYDSFCSRGENFVSEVNINLDHKRSTNSSTSSAVDRTSSSNNDAAMIGAVAGVLVVGGILNAIFGNDEDSDSNSSLGYSSSDSSDISYVLVDFESVCGLISCSDKNLSISGGIGTFYPGYSGAGSGTIHQNYNGELAGNYSWSAQFDDHYCAGNFYLSGGKRNLTISAHKGDNYGCSSISYYEY